jgi:hypothetical protein
MHGYMAPVDAIEVSTCYIPALHVYVQEGGLMASQPSLKPAARAVDLEEDEMFEAVPEHFAFDLDELEVSR